MTPDILRLPDELLLTIVEYLQGKDIKTVRASCMKFNCIASPYLYPILYLSCHQLDLDVFRLVAENPLLIGGVRELIIDDTTFPTCINSWAAYKNAVTLLALLRRRTYDPFQQHAHPPLDDLLEEDSRVWEGSGRYDLFHRMTMERKYWELFNNISQGHHENRLAHADINALKQALPHFKSLRRLVITNRTAYEHPSHGAQSRDNTSPVVKLWRRVASDGNLWGAVPLAPRCDWMPPRRNRSLAQTNTLDWLDDGFCTSLLPNGMPETIPDLLLPENSVDAEWDDGSFYVGLHYDYNQETIRRAERTNCHPSIPSREARAMHVALHVLEDAKVCSRLQEFRVDASTDLLDSKYDTGLPITLFSHESPFTNRLPHAFAMGNIKKLQLILGNENYAENGRKIMDQGYVTQILASMPQLEEIYFEPHGMATVGALPQDMIYPRLRIVTFRCGEIDPEKLVSFVQRHESTLEDISIAYCNIPPNLEQGWQDAADQITNLRREGALPRLVHLNFHQVFIGETVVACGRTSGFSKAHYDEEEVNRKDVHTWYLWEGDFTRELTSQEERALRLQNRGS